MFSIDEKFKKQKTSFLTVQGIYKIKYRRYVVLYIHLSPINKSKYKIEFDWLIGVLNIIKIPFIPFLSKSS